MVDDTGHEAMAAVLEEAGALVRGVLKTHLLGIFQIVELRGGLAGESVLEELRAYADPCPQRRGPIARQQ